MLAGLPVDLSSVSSTQLRQLMTTWTSSSFALRGSNPFFWPPWAHAHTWETRSFFLQQSLCGRGLDTRRTLETLPSAPPKLEQWSYTLYSKRVQGEDPQVSWVSGERVESFEFVGPQYCSSTLWLFTQALSTYRPKSSGHGARHQLPGPKGLS